MTTRRPNPYLHVSWLSKALVGDKSCLWAYWYKSNNQGYCEGAQRLQCRALADGPHRAAERARRQAGAAGLRGTHRAPERFSRGEVRAPVS